MFARMRAGSTCSPSRHSRAALAAPPDSASSSDSALHSACQWPAARSCSYSPPVSTPAFACASRAHARARTARIGLCLCGIAVDTPPGASETSPTSVCASRTTSRPTFADGLRARVERCGQLCDRPPVRVPGHDGLLEPELAREQAQHVDPLRAERCERPRRSAELGRQPDGAEPRARLGDGDEPAGRLGAEGGRHRLLEQGARGERRRAVLFRQSRARAREAGELLVDQRACAAGDEHRGAVERVLGRRAEVHVLRVLADTAAQRAHERLDRVARGPPLLAQLGDVVQLGPARVRDRGSRRRRDEARVGLRFRERQLDLEERGEPGVVRHGRAQRRRHEDRRERRQWAKKTVARSPCMRISKRKAPFSCMATSVSRSGPASEDSTGSVSFASASSGK